MNNRHKKICIIGAFGFHMVDKTTGGQPAKTRQLYYTLTDYYGSENITHIETYGWKSHPIRMLLDVLKCAKCSDAMIMLPAHNGVQIFSRLLIYCKKHYGTKIFYDVIGGWLAEKTGGDQALGRRLMQFDGVWVESNSMKRNLEQQGFTNVTVVPNFRKMKILTPDELEHSQEYPLQMCTFSRVMKEKGIETAVDVVNNINSKLGYAAIKLDIYGPIEEADREWFEHLIQKFNENVSYKGCVKPNESGEVLRKYVALLFPTHFYTEGVPGTVIDAYCAGVPVISAKWSNFYDVVEEGKTGLGYSFDDAEEFARILFDAVETPRVLLDMKNNCIERAWHFHSDHVVKTIASDLKEKGI